MNICKILAVLAALSFGMQGCGTKGFTVQGNITGAEAQKFTVWQIGSRMTLVDSGTVSNKGTFSFSGIAAEPQLYKISFEQGKDALVVLHTGKSNFTGTWANLEKTYALSSSEYTTTAKAILQKLRQNVADKNTLTLLSKKFTNEKNTIQLKKVEEELAALQASMDRDLIRCADTTKCLAVAALAANLVQPQNNVTWLQKFYKQNLAKYPTSAYAQELFTTHMPELEKMARTQIDGATDTSTITKAAAPRTDGAVLAPDFALSTIEGTPFTLSSMRGKYVLVDFWASWCGPCRAENPNVVAAYNKYKDKNFTVLGVSLDDDKDDWKAAIAKDGLTWTHVSDLQKWASVVVRLYSLNSIPSNVLLDPEGYIIAKDLREDALQQKLAEVLR